jgi:hypothetical protein
MEGFPYTVGANGSINTGIPWSNPQYTEGAAAEAIVANQPGKKLRILSFNFDLKTSGVAGERFVGYEVNILGQGTLIEALTPPLATINNLYGICGSMGFTTPSATSRTALLPLPANLLIPFGSKWEAIAPIGKQAGDTFPLFRLAFEYV